MSYQHVALTTSNWRPGPFNRFYFVASYVKEPKKDQKKIHVVKQCQGCNKEISAHSIQVVFVREIYTPKFPAQKRKLYHPVCVPTWMVTSVQLYSDSQHKECYRDEELSVADKSNWRVVLGSNHESTTHSAHRGYKRKRCQQASDEDFMPGISDDAKRKKRFVGACRHVVSGLISTFKAQYFQENGREDGRIKCPLSQRWLTADEVHIDHEYPQTFDHLMHEFVKSVKPAHMAFHQFIGSVEFVYGHFFDARLSASFFDFHQNNAKLRVVSAKRNLALPKLRMDEAEKEEVSPNSTQG